jgi:Oxidoreductase molybdopterin binding domain
MRPQHRIWLGGLIGIILTAPLVAIFYAGYRRAGLPFVPFHIFDWGTRILPGVVLTLGIETMVRAIRWLNLAGTSTVAKLAEQTMAIAGFIFIGMIFGGIFFVCMRFEKRKFAIAAGLFTGGLLGLAALLVNNSIDRTSSADPVEKGFWIMLLFLAWGAALGWAYRYVIRDDVAGRADLAASGLERRDRRRFIIRLGGAAAVISLMGATLGKRVGSREAASHQQGEPWSAHNPLPNANAAVKPAPGTRPELTPVNQHYRIDINTFPPRIQEESWRLKISGLVERPLALTLDDLRRSTPMHQFITLSPPAPCADLATRVPRPWPTWQATGS